MRGGDEHFYGVTGTGGENRRGSIFRIDPDGTFATVYEFRAAADQDAPAFGTLGDIEHALFAGRVTLHDKIRGRYETRDADGRLYGASDAEYAASASMSSSVRAVTTWVMRSDQRPWRVPTCMSYIWRTR